jgi:sulfite reductase (NADPH) flavoprotein alpha-component
VINALERAECVIVQDDYHPTETSRYADILLPGAVWAEAEGTMVNSERTVTLMQKAVEPPGDARPDWEIIARVAQAMGFMDAFSYQSAGEVFDEIRRTVNPRTGYDLRGMSYDRLRTESPQWPCVHASEAGQPIRYVSPTSHAIVFPTESGKGRFLARPYLPPAELPNADFPFILTTGRTAHQWHTMTKTGKVPALNKLNPAPFLELNPEDAASLEISGTSVVEVTSSRGRFIYPVRITDRIRPGCCFAPLHWNDNFGENLAINTATSEAVDPISKQPEFKFCAVRVTKVHSQSREVSGFSSNAGAAIEAGFTPAQQATLEGIFQNLRGKIVVSRFPARSPFTESQRQWLETHILHSAEEASTRGTDIGTGKAAVEPQA